MEPQKFFDTMVEEFVSPVKWRTFNWIILEKKYQNFWGTFPPPIWRPTQTIQIGARKVGTGAPGL